MVPTMHEVRWCDDIVRTGVTHTSKIRKLLGV